MLNGQASKMLGNVLLQIYEKEGMIQSVRDEKKWKVFKDLEVKKLRDRLLGFLNEK